MTPEQNRLVEQNIGLVRILVRTHTPPGPWRREDLMSAGYEALCRAATRWDPGEGCTFSSYAYKRINGAFLDELRTLKFGSRNSNAEQPISLISESQEPSAPDDYTHLEIEELLSDLPERERTIVRLRMEGMPSGQIAKEMGVHPTRISQIVNEVYQQVKAA